MSDPALAATLRRLRTERGDNQEDVAYEAGITTATYARIELGQSNPSWQTVRSVAEALNVSLVELAEAVEREEH